jgi:DNA invertase Pin-like site-specific DNA recombinase
MDLKEELLKGKNIYELNLKVTYYARVSTDNTTQASSIINQINYFKNYIKTIPNWQLINGYIDEGISGKAIKNRINFQKMIKDGLNHHYDLILTKSVSRFARNTIDSIHYTDLLKNNGIGVIFINDNINTLNSDSEFRLTLMASIAQDEIRKLSESVKFGLHQSINRGIVLGNNNILGYQKNNGKLIINFQEQPIVKDIFNLFSTNKYSYNKLSQIINEKYNKHYDSTSIKRILTNYKYKGYYCGNKTTVIDYKNNKRKILSKTNWLIYKDHQNIPPIIDEQLWNKVNKIIQKRTTPKNQNKYQIYCTIHKKNYHYITKKYHHTTYHYYTCNKCSSINEKLINTLATHHNITKILATKEEETLKLLVNIKN